MKLALAGDTMLGRGVGDVLRRKPPDALIAPEVVELAREADLFVLNLECCISERGEPWPDPRKPFFFRAPPAAVDLLDRLGVDCVTLANNHALDYGALALLDTLDYLKQGGILAVGAGADVNAARQPAILEAEGMTIAVVSVADHPPEYAATADRAGIAFAELGTDPLPPWLAASITGAGADIVVVSPHWGPNMIQSPVPRVRAAARAFVDSGATLVAGHSAHVFHGVGGRVLYDLGDFLDDYAVDPRLRNDLGLLFLVTIGLDGPTLLEAVPLELAYAHTRLAEGDDAAWILRRFRAACAGFGTDVREVEGRATVDLGAGAGGGPSSNP
jgi:poly-gamma-glutamate synthesis protein (capsule biosynthesis protein)